MLYAADDIIASGQFFTRKTDWRDFDGWQVEFAGGDGGSQLSNARGASRWGPYHLEHSFFLRRLVSLSYVYDGDVVDCYTNGVLCSLKIDGEGVPSSNASNRIDRATDNGKPLQIAKTLLGVVDEIRLRGGSLSADRIKADYDMISHRKFCTYGAVKKGSE